MSPEVVPGLGRWPVAGRRTWVLGFWLVSCVASWSRQGTGDGGPVFEALPGGNLHGQRNL